MRHQTPRYWPHWPLELKRSAPRGSPIGMDSEDGVAWSLTRGARQTMALHRRPRSLLGSARCTTVADVLRPSANVDVKSDNTFGSIAAACFSAHSDGCDRLAL